MVTKRIPTLLLAVLLMACGDGQRISTPAQEKRYNACQESFRSNKNILSMIGTGTDDSTRMLIDDVLELDIETFAEKHELTQQELDTLLQSIEITRQIIQTFDQLNKGLGR